jgi:hypothetical protein
MTHLNLESTLAVWTDVSNDIIGQLSGRFKLNMSRLVRQVPENKLSSCSNVYRLYAYVSSPTHLAVGFNETMKTTRQEGNGKHHSTAEFSIR